MSDPASSAPAPDFIAAFDAVVAAQPEALAVVAPEGSWSYGALKEASERLAAELVRSGVRPGSVVALALGRSALHAVAILATWRVGAAFLPLDPLAPAARQRACLEDVQATATLRVAKGRIAVERADPISAPVTSAPGDSAENRLAYVIYTSGSSGAPKGVRVGHPGLVPMLRAQIEAFALAPGKRALFALSTAFDASLSDLGTALLSGAALVVTPALLMARDVADFLHLNAVTHADLPPSLLARIDLRTLPPTLETVVIGGEVCAPETVRAWARRVNLVNVYGPTEATICTSLVRCDPATWDRPRIGHPLAHVDYRVEDGELLIGGPALAMGYVNRPLLEAERFVQRDGRRFYRTGDRVRGSERDEGGLEFVGRLDRQVKVRGQLVSPEEIELALLAMSEVAEAVVTVGDDPAKARLTAEVVLREAARSDPAVNEDTLRARLAETLPRWMLPRVVLARALPRSSRGKRERDPRVRVIAAAFAETLGASEVASDSDFFALGGDSLAAVEIAARAQAEGVVFEVSAVLERRTPAAIARSEASRGLPVAELEAVVDERIARAELRPPVTRITTVIGAQPPERGGDWLVTGATGFLGQRVLGELLARTDRPVHCLVRAPDDAAARERLLTLGVTSRQVIAHAGDTTAPHLGLGEARWTDLASRVGHVVHLAAAVNQALSFEMLASANVTAALQVARFALAGGGIPLTHVSTLAVLAASDVGAGSLDEKTALGPTNRVFGGYAQSKYAAEALLRRLLPAVQVLRPGLLTGDSRTGRSAERCPLATFLRALADLGCVAREATADGRATPRVDVTPVDHAARVIVSLLLAPEPGRVVHVASRGATLADLLAAVRSRTEVREVDPAEFLQRARDRLTRGSALSVASASYRLLGQGVARDTDLFLLTGHVFDCALAEELTGLVCPPADRALLVRYVDSVLAGSA